MTKRPYLRAIRKDEIGMSDEPVLGVWNIFTPEQHKFMIDLCLEIIKAKQHGEVVVRIRNGRLHSIVSSRSWITSGSRMSESK